MIYVQFCFAMIFICLSTLSIAQVKHDYTWIFGYNSQSGHPLHGNPILDFNNGNLEIQKEYLPVEYSLTNANISDATGNFLFSSNGCIIADADFEVMENGEELNPGGMGFYENSCLVNGGYLISEGMIILPKPYNENNYYLLHQAGTFSQTPPLVYNNILYYSQVDMTLQNGLGSVIEKNQIILEDTLHSGDLEAVKHSNNVDWWVLASKRKSNKQFVILLTEVGIAEIIEQQVGLSTNDGSTGSGQAVFSPDGSKYARFNKFDQIFLYDFDRQTGQLSNFQQLIATDSMISVGGVSFSPNNRFLYVSTQFNIYQYDLWAADIAASKVEVGTYDGFLEFDISPVTFFLMQLGPDCRIYIIPPNGSQYMHVIHNPNEKGLACNFEQRAIKLPALNGISLPNFPNYRLGTGYPVCDSSIILTASPAIFKSTEVLKLYPNPAQDNLYLELFEPFQNSGELVLYNQMGQEMQRFVLADRQTEFQFSVSDLAAGIYFYQLLEKGILRNNGKLIVHK